MTTSTQGQMKFYLGSPVRELSVKLTEGFLESLLKFIELFNLYPGVLDDGGDKEKSRFNVRR